MLRALVLLLALAACSSQPPTAGGYSPHAPTPMAVRGADAEESGAPNPPPAAAYVALSCTAEALHFCPPRGCDANNPGFDRAAPIALTTPNAGAEMGRFCNGSDCQPAFFQHFRERNQGLAATIWTGQGWTRPEGELSIGRSHSRFQLTKPASDGVLVWSGVCQPSGS